MILKDGDQVRGADMADLTESLAEYQRQLSGPHKGPDARDFPAHAKRMFDAIEKEIKRQEAVDPE